MQRKSNRRLGRWWTLVAVLGLALGAVPAVAAPASAAQGPVAAAFASAAGATGVPQPLLQSLCYVEGRMSAHQGRPSLDGGYGCMHLVRNQRTDTLGEAASLLNIPVATLQQDTPANIAGGAAVLRAEALSLSPTHTL